MNKQLLEDAINGLEQLKPVLQRMLIRTNYEGLGREDAQELGEHFDIALECMQKQLTGGWIPVSERLPEENGHYLVTYHEWGKGDYLPEFDFTCIKILRFYRGEFKMPICCDNKIDDDIGREVLAWRELPEPYKEG